MNLPSFKFTVLDTETTGFLPKVHHIIEFASMRYENGELAQEYEQLLHAKEVPGLVEVLTRIKTKDLEDKPSFDEKRDEILAAIGEDTLIVGQNVGFDIGMLKGSGIDLSERPWIDTSMLASLVFPELESYSLGYMSEVLNLNHYPHHRALGDVRATLEMLEKCWLRLQELPEEMLAPVREIMKKSSPGYRLLFDALPVSISTTRPAWLESLKETRKEEEHPVAMTLDLTPQKQEEILLVEEPLDPLFLRQAIDHSLGSTRPHHWICVKNLEATLGRLPQLADVNIVYPPFLLVDTEGVVALLKQDTFTADEATLSAKLHWYHARTRNELPVHGGEEAVWSAKIACTPRSPLYLDQFASPSKVSLLDHRQLFSLLRDTPEAARHVLNKDLHILIDDASMLEDTATKAFGYECSVDTLLAAAKGNEQLDKFVSLLQLWIEKVRMNQDLRYLMPNDLTTAESNGLREQLQTVLQADWSPQIRAHLECVAHVVQPENLEGMITYIETRQNGSQFLHSVPESIGTLLKTLLFDKFYVTLFVPSHTGDSVQEILPRDALTTLRKETQPSCRLQVEFTAEPTLDQLFQNPPEGKTIILIPSKGTIENLYVKYTEELEEKDVTLICLGVGGGQGRMTAEFLAAKGTALWLITPWMFEGIELPPNTVDRLILLTLPFDHPSHPVLSKRANKYKDAFTEYSLPRLTHRLFRLMRTFCRMRTADGSVRILDERLHSKAYGTKLKRYLVQFSEGAAINENASNGKQNAGNTKKKEADQLPLF
ncbi:MAG: putative ATP-dependent helicase DinG [Candidatus Peribacteria bacterium]|nr:putative ATP-dependent helicase DinG [Candidatus Peribacteria bacterium]